MIFTFFFAIVPTIVIVVEILNEIIKYVTMWRVYAWQINGTLYIIFIVFRIVWIFFRCSYSEH